LLVKIYSTLHITWPLDEIGFICQIFGITALVIALISIPIHRIGVNGDIEKYKDVVQSVEEARKNESIENAALQTVIIETNKWLAGAKYWNTHHFDIYYPDKVMDLERIK
jgi:hypothetical protein